MTLLEELRHRLRNTDRHHSDSETDQIIEKYLEKMANPGYGRSTREQVIRSAVMTFYREVLVDRTGGRRLYRSSEEMARSHTYKGLQVNNWFKPKKGREVARLEKDSPCGMGEGGGRGRRGQRQGQ